MARITVVTGPPAAGKSSYIAEHAKPGDVRLDLDEIAVALGSPDPHDAPETIRGLARTARAAALEQILDGIDVDAWVIHTRIWPAQAARYEAAGADVVTVDPGIDETLARAAADGRPAWTEQAIRDWYAQSAETGKEAHVADMYTRYVAKVLEQPEVADEGRFSAIVSAFDVLDSQGDVVDRGAFAESVERVKAGEVLPLVWSHDYRDPFAIIGEITAMEEVEKGLYIEGQLDVDESPMAAQVYRQMKKRRLKEFSIGGEIVEWYWDEPKDAPASFHIKKLDLWEAGPCFKGANPNTELLSIKARLQREADPAATDGAEGPTVIVKVVPDLDALPKPQPDEPIRLTFHQRASIQLQAMCLDHEGES